MALHCNRHFVHYITMFRTVCHISDFPTIKDLGDSCFPSPSCLLVFGFCKKFIRPLPTLARRFRIQSFPSTRLVTNKSYGLNLSYHLTIAGGEYIDSYFYRIQNHLVELVLHSNSALYSLLVAKFV